MKKITGNQRLIESIKTILIVLEAVLSWIKDIDSQWQNEQGAILNKISSLVLCRRVGYIYMY